MFLSIMEDYYKGLQRIYFYRVLNQLIKIGKLNDKKVLDFGCGIGKLEQKLGNNVVGYDIKSKYTKINDWTKIDFDIVVVNGVLYAMSEKEIRCFFDLLKKIKPNTELIIAIYKQNWLSNFGKWILNNKTAVDELKTIHQRRIKILREEMNIIVKKNIFFMCDIYLTKFKF